MLVGGFCADTAPRPGANLLAGHLFRKPPNWQRPFEYEPSLDSGHDAGRGWGHLVPQPQPVPSFPSTPTLPVSPAAPVVPILTHVDSASGDGTSAENHCHTGSPPQQAGPQDRQGSPPGPAQPLPQLAGRPSPRPLPAPACSSLVNATMPRPPPIAQPSARIPGDGVLLVPGPPTQAARGRDSESCRPGPGQLLLH